METDSAMATRRQRPGVACDECRRRKLRCDGQQPQCGVCEETGVACQVTNRGARGPKKGHLKALKNRIVQLEAMLQSRSPAQQQQPDFRGSTPSGHELTPCASPVTALESTANEDPEEWLPTATATSASEYDTSLPHASAPGLAFLPHEWTPPLTLPISNTSISPNALETELDQLYLDRVHQSIPIIHQRRYMSWSKSTTKTASQRCLQYAMWTLASLLSVQSRDMIEPLYQETKQMLEYLSVPAMEQHGSTTELSQAWVLLVSFESMRAYHRQAWMSAGRAFRLVQAMRYHEIDSPVDKGGASSPQSGDLIEIEERRRVFWMAYFLDHVISMRDDWPITLNEHVVRTAFVVELLEFAN
ncbi:fungal-specific transcription factor domain-containing protein [Penicillium canariense]|uniref:Fungal-specific transcription factor domain-containing protein n=1 Tax=Penicillium canariense TaxID=189055 RepID=A0A9W9I4I9_9EURO|nr:fungal-specific transcription factor domain-containing protein [Penicillium canariense]KAJ5166966.1 fungal-specific transcription factor domain-containing protein [Penicillium canariense]